MASITALLIGSLSYAFIILLVLRFLRVNYYNPVVKSFVRLLSPLTSIFTIVAGDLVGIFLAAVVFKFISFYII